MKPVQIRGALSVFQYILEGPEPSAHMIEHAVQHDFDACGMQFFTDLFKILIGAEALINQLVISGVVAVGIRLKDR